MEEAFTKVYEEKHWGDNGETEYSGSSGSGSSLEYNKSYIPYLREVIKMNHIKTVVDLGCGDFKCGPAIYEGLDVSYTGYDVYKKIVDYNTSRHPNYTFKHLDFCNKKEEIIRADICILKDVIQHWSLDNIYTFLDYLVDNKCFKFILLVNCCHQIQDNQDIYNGDFRPLSSKFLPLKKYKAIKVHNYGTKEVCLIV